MYTSTLLSLLVAAATAGLARAATCPPPTADGWIASYRVSKNSGITYCTWTRCGEAEGVIGWAPAYFTCGANHQCLSSRAHWCIDPNGNHYESTQVFGKPEKREVSAKGEGKKWEA
jgi:hypothetical protein